MNAARSCRARFDDRAGLEGRRLQVDRRRVLVVKVAVGVQSGASDDGMVRREGQRDRGRSSPAQRFVEALALVGADHRDHHS